MANITETAQWEAAIREIATTDPVVGGPTGPANIQAQQLANRTAYLKDQITQLNGSEIFMISSSATPASYVIPAYSFVAVPFNGPVRVNTAALNQAMNNISEFVVPDGYSLARLSACISIDPNDSSVVSAIMLRKNGFTTSSFATGSGNKGTFTAGETIALNIVTPFMNVVAGDRIGLIAYASAASTVIDRDRAWMQIELL